MGCMVGNGDVSLPARSASEGFSGIPRWRSGLVGFLHPFHRPNAQQIEAALDDPGRQVAQQQPALAQGRRLGLQHGAILEEAAVRLGQVPQVRRDQARLDSRRPRPSAPPRSERVATPRPAPPASPDSTGRRLAPQRRRIDAALAEDAPVADVGVLHVRRGVAVHRHHLVADRICSRWSGSATGRRTSPRRGRPLRKSSAAFRRSAPALPRRGRPPPAGPSHRLAPPAARPRRAGRSARGTPPSRVLSGLPSLPSTEPNEMCSSSADTAPAPGCVEQVGEMLLLPEIDDVQDRVGIPFLHPVADRGQVGGGVGEGAVALADQRRRGVLAPRQDDRPLALPRHALRQKVLRPRPAACGL